MAEPIGCSFSYRPYLLDLIEVWRRTPDIDPCGCLKHAHTWTHTHTHSLSLCLSLSLSQHEKNFTIKCRGLFFTLHKKVNLTLKKLEKYCGFCHNHRINLQVTENNRRPPRLPVLSGDKTNRPISFVRCKERATVRCTITAAPKVNGADRTSLNYSDNDTSVLNASPHCTAHPQVWEWSTEKSVTYERSLDIWPTCKKKKKIF